MRKLRGYIAFEGADGAGKSSILAAVQHHLREEGATCFPTKMNSWLDPDAARVLIDARERRRAHPRATIEAAYHRDLEFHARDFIVPARARGVILQDRSLISAAIYQDVLFGSEAAVLLERYHAAHLPMPNLIVLVSLPSGEAARRLLARNSEPRFWETEAHLARIQSTFDEILSDRAPRWLPRVVRFSNEQPGELLSRVQLELMSAIRSSCQLDEVRAAES